MNTTLNTNQEIVALDLRYNTNKIEIKALTKDNKNIIKTVLNIVLKELKDINRNDKYIKFNKKAKLQIISIKLDCKINQDFRKLFKSVSIYLLSKTNLDLNTISVSKLNKGMALINNGTYTRFKSNNEMINAINKDIQDKLIAKVNKLINKED